jgi:predicted anti-sigma-YlaC factor YlaD
MLVSLGLDGELSQVGKSRLRAHVGRCAACAAFALDLEALTQELRTAPLERPSVAQVQARRRSALRMLQVGVAAAAVVLAAGFGSLAGSLTSDGPSTHGSRTPLFARAGTHVLPNPSRPVAL